MLSLKNKRVLITGGAGFIGSHLVDRLIAEKPVRIVVVDNFFLGTEKNLVAAKQDYPELAINRLDASDLPSMQQVVDREGIEIVFNLAVIPLPTSLEYPSWTISTNVAIATVFCELARQKRIRTLVHCSSSEAYGSALYSSMDESHPLVPTTPYAASKAAADQIVLSYHQTFGIDAVIVRPFNNFGPRQNPGSYAGILPIILNKISKGEPIEIFGDGEQTRDYLYVKDTANAMVKVYESEPARGQVINVATGHEITINALVARIIGVLGLKGYSVIHKAARPGDVRRHRGDVQLLKRLTGYEPKAISDYDLAETVSWYQKG